MEHALRPGVCSGGFVTAQNPGSKFEMINEQFSKAENLSPFSAGMFVCLFDQSRAQHSFKAF